ncbi:tumor necrosis factor receptor superfamily member 14-like [Engraulis encrasicolus]|uniref:tumor necrosis factor receptor superfamily member 14-like n=1 Tax=Engraulis encrasicolus TaxID=184585 RepID=UPI002FD1972B
MLSFLFVLSVFAILQSSVNCSCRRAEYLSVSGECCPMCQRGLVVRKDCTEFSSTSCIPCIDGTYMDEPNGYNKCHQCKTCDSGQGLKTRQKCTSTDDARCEVVDGYYCESFSSQEDCSFAVKHAVCTRGQRIKIPGSKTSDTECEKCPKGQNSTHGFNCSAWTDCSAIRKEKAEDGSPISDVVCKDVRQRYALLVCAVLSFILYGFAFYQIWRKYQSERAGSDGISLPKPIEETDARHPSSHTHDAVISRIPSDIRPQLQPESNDSAYGSTINNREEIDSHEPQALSSELPSTPATPSGLPSIQT